MLYWLWVPQAHAESSMRLQQEQLAEGIALTYLRENQPDLRFVLDPKQLITQSASARRYTPAQAKDYVRHQLLVAAAKFQQEGARVTISSPAQALSFQVSGPVEVQKKVAAALEQLQQQAYQDFLAERQLYRLATPQGQYFIIPDHVAVLTQQRPILQPIARAFIELYGQNNIRKIASQVALWVQQIPYQDLSNRQSSAGSGYISPWQLLIQHRGDCDSKAVLFAGVLQQIFPNIKIAIIYFTDHAVIAAKIPAIRDETTVLLEGSPFLIIDATGPALTPIGTLARKYQLSLQSQQFSYRFF